MPNFFHRDDLSTEEAETMFRTYSTMFGPRRKLLEAHFSMPGYTATSTQLAQAVGYKSFHAANLHYGLFAKSLVEEMGWQHRFITSGGRTYPLWAFIDFSKKKGEMWQLTLRGEAVEALKRMGWENAAR